MDPRVPDLIDSPQQPADGNGHADVADPVDALFAPPQQPGPPPEVRKRKPKLKKLRLFLVFAGIAGLAVISTIFGLMMSVSSDLPSLENHAQLRIARNSILYAGSGKEVTLAKLTGAQNRILDESNEISPNVKNAVIAIEDKRFYEHSGVDYRGIARAVVEDVLRQRAAQGASTITQQFVKNVLEAQGSRTVFQKLREAALAYHLERQWTKDKILTQYLNTIYFGNGAYGIEAAARTYFGASTVYDPHAVKRATNLQPWQAAYIAGMIASPSAYDPVQHPVASHARMNLVLLRMLQQGMINRAQYDEQKNFYVNPKRVRPPRPDSRVPYFSSWVTQQMLDRYRSTGLVFGGGLKVTTSLDSDLQTAAEQAIQGRLAGIGPSASLVAIDNKTGEVKAMVGGSDFERRPFNLATNGHRQPGSSFKPFTLIGALEKGVSPGRTFASSPHCWSVPHSKGEKFCPKNYNDAYAGITTLTGATINSDNSVYSQLGIDIVGTNKVARVAHLMGIRTPLSRNYAMILGGLQEGVTPLEMAYAYSTLANNGERVWGTMGPTARSPVAIEKVLDPDGHTRDQNHIRHTRVIPYGTAQTAKGILSQVITSGTGKAAQIDEFAAGKTGTTENYGDAWFVGFNKDLTVAVWVGYPDKLRPMLTEYHGQPVAGGTFPAEIWHDFMTSWIKLRDTRKAAREGKDPSEVTTSQTTPTPVVTSTTPTQTAPAQTPPATTPQAKQPTQQAPAQQTPAPTQPAPQQPAPAPQPAPTDGGGGTQTPPPPGNATGQAQTTG
ncbi:MAG TPA: transglycosylase domain-containing protein [Thermoleophilaceae bacterium]|nr:transglycosylase domain-containing protein [Thermoleophilaceae bacterium]